MKRPLNLSNLMHVAELRHIQSVHEAGDMKGPDCAVRHFLPALRRWRLAWLDKRRLNEARSDPFYYYLLARTRYYDEVFRQAAEDGLAYIVNVGCGRDTRAYRNASLLGQRGTRLLECDQAAALADRRRVAVRRKAALDISYVAVDLNAAAQPELRSWLEQQRDHPGLLMMEGVSPYINEVAHTRFFKMLSTSMAVGSRVAYDFKIRGIAGDRAVAADGTPLFRLPPKRGGITAYHEDCGYRVAHSESGAELTMRDLPGIGRAGAQLYQEDYLVQLEVGPS